jgi:hypothetical protein
VDFREPKLGVHLSSLSLSLFLSLSFSLSIP